MNRSIRTLLAAALVGLAAAANCQGSASSDPLYCQAVIPGSGGVRYCNSQALQVNDSAPLEVSVTNDAFYKNSPISNTWYVLDETVYLPGFLRAGKRMQIVFACKTIECTDAHDDLFEYTGTFEPGKDPEDVQAVQDWKDGGRNGPRPTVDRLDGRVSFTMGQHPGEVGLCNNLVGSVNRNLACGYITILDDVRARSGPACTCVPCRARPSP